MGKTGLKRKLGIGSLAGIVVANMIGAGIFTTSGLLMDNLPNPILILVLWLTGGFIALLGAVVYGKIGTYYPYAGGEYLYITRIFHPLPGFLSGWISFIVGFSAPVAASAIAFGEYFLNGLGTNFQQPENAIMFRKGLAIMIVVIFTLTHLGRIETSAGVQNILTFVKILLIIFLVTAGLLTGNGDHQRVFINSGLPGEFSGLKAAGLSLIWIMFAYSGWNASSYLGSEIKNPDRNLPLSLLIGTGLVIILYLALNYLFVYAIPIEQMKGVLAVGSLAARQLFGAAVERIFSLFVAIALLSSISAFIILGPRIYYAMAENGHFFSFAGKIHPRARVPYYSVIIQSTISIIMILTGTFDQILTYMGFSLSIFPVITAFGIFFIKDKDNPPGMLYKTAAALFIILFLIILFLTLAERPVESLIAVAIVLTGIPVYFRVKKSKLRDY